MEKEAQYFCINCDNLSVKSSLLKCSNSLCQSFLCFSCFSKIFPDKSLELYISYKQNKNWTCLNCNKINKDSSLQNNQNFERIETNYYKRNDKKNLKNLLNSDSTVLNNIDKNKNFLENKVISFKDKFPNYLNNFILNSIVLKSAVLSHVIKIGRHIKLSNKPCILCSQFRCPQGIEIIKFKTYDDYLTFLDNLFIQLEVSQKQTQKNNSKVPNEIYEKIKSQKKSVEQVREIIKNQYSKIESKKLKGPKRFCTNCISNLFQEQNGVFSIFENLKDEDELISLGQKRKLEIIQGLQWLIEKEKANENSNKEKSKSTNNHNYLQDYSPISSSNGNIFNIIFEDALNKNENQFNYCNVNMMNRLNIPNQQQEQMRNPNYYNYQYNFNPNFFIKTNNSQNNLFYYDSSFSVPRVQQFQPLIPQSFLFPNGIYFSQCLQQNEIASCQLCQMFLEKIYQMTVVAQKGIEYLQTLLLQNTNNTLEGKLNLNDKVIMNIFENISILNQNITNYGLLLKYLMR